jgi:hypothetical protein
MQPAQHQRNGSWLASRRGAMRGVLTAKSACLADEGAVTKLVQMQATQSI